MRSKDELLEDGMRLAEVFCIVNSLDMPTVTVHSGRSPFSACAYYRDGHINIWPADCSSIGTVGRQWSYPGYTVDRTPYGVIQHELGHHYDFCKGASRQKYSSEWSASVRETVKEEPITSYCPDDAEWFAEMFRLFVTNPDLLCAIRPKTYTLMRWTGLYPVFYDAWQDRLKGCPKRTEDVAHKKVWEARGKFKNGDDLFRPLKPVVRA